MRIMLFSSLLRGFEIWDDGTCILRPACKTHIGPTALADVVGSCHSAQVFSAYAVEVRRKEAAQMVSELQEARPN